MDKVKSASSPPANADNTDLSGRRLGDFQVIRRLGKGGMGQVFLAEQLSLKRKVALKFLRADLAGNPTALERFRAEALAMARVTHANIVQVYAADEADGLQFIALEYIEGRTLREFVEKKGPPDGVLAVSIMRQGASALLRAAELGIIHRDIKPDNILLTRKGEVKIADFGLARVLDSDRPALNLTQNGVVMGTPTYMSPEQVEGKPLDTRSDLYSFGVTCYHMLAGRAPFRGATAFEVAIQHLQAQAEPLASVRSDLPEPLCGIVHKLMAKLPADRYQTSRDLLRDIVRVRDGLASTATAPQAASVDLIPSVELLPVAPALDSGRTSVRPLIKRLGKPQRWLPIAFVGSLALAVCLGAVLARARRPPADALTSASNPAASQDADVQQVDVILSKKRRDEVLLAALEPLLAQAELAKPENTPAGLNLCQQLAVFYLDEHKLDEGKKFFARLESINNVPAYKHVGRVARAVVLALQDKPRESNALFLEIATALLAREAAKKKLEVPGLKKILRGEILRSASPRFRYWVAEALHYNQRNGIDDAEVPEAFLHLREEVEAAAKPRQ